MNLLICLKTLVLINDAPDDENWIKSLVRNLKFQKWDLKEKARLEAKNNRAKGV